MASPAGSLIALARLRQFCAPLDILDRSCIRSELDALASCTVSHACENVFRAIVTGFPRDREHPIHGNVNTLAGIVECVHDPVEQRSRCVERCRRLEINRDFRITFS